MNEFRSLPDRDTNIYLERLAPYQAPSFDFEDKVREVFEARLKTMDMPSKRRGWGYKDARVDQQWRAVTYVTENLGE